MENCYTRSSLAMLNDKTKDLKNLDGLGIYLAKQNDASALKLLRLIILASENKKLIKDFHIDSIKKSTETIGRDTYKRQETILYNLSKNPQHLGLDLMDFVLQNFDVNLKLNPFDSSYTIFDFWIRSLVRIEYANDVFYKRYDMIDKKLDMIIYMLKNSLLDEEDTEALLDALNTCLNQKYHYTEAQLLKMREIANSIKLKKQLRTNLTKLIDEEHMIIEGTQEDIIKQLLDDGIKKEEVNRKKFFYTELDKYDMNNDDCAYIYATIPSLIKKHIIK